MANGLKDVVLNYPGTHSVGDTRKVVAAFKAINPAIYDEWEDIELHAGKRGEDPLTEVSAQVLRFLMEECTVSNNMAAISMFGDMRRIVGQRQ
ncbi:hypothetical protein [Sphingomonas sp.]|uniref:hypothetical protein n=1 Tax=Sphingomonas sp. TaxID=28214 RepID=UPI0025D33D0B|nr:hypothetical protein [Sphingomonas sp.]